MKNYLWLIKREFWENRAIWLVPLAIGVLLILAALFGPVGHVPPTTDLQQSRQLGGMTLAAFGVTFFAVMTLYSTWYLLDCLYADRKDRSILFWKSLPISDTETVLAKLLTALIVIPAVYFVAADIATLFIAFIISVRARPLFGNSLWHPDLWLQLQALWVYVIVTSALWYLPFTGYLLLVSAWARRAVMLWSVLPVIAAYLMERYFFGTHWVGYALWARTADYPAHAFSDLSDPAVWATTMVDAERFTSPTSVWHLLNPMGFLLSPATWIGLGVGVLFIIGAIQLRLRRSEI